MDDYHYYQHEAAMEEFLEESLKNMSREHAKYYLGTYGDAIECRVRRCLAEARSLNTESLPGPALVAAVTAIELIIRFLLLRPLVQGAFLSDEWARILMDRIATGRTAEDRKLLPAVLRQWSIDVTSLALNDGRQLWPLISELADARNNVVHQSSTASEADAASAIECAETLLTSVVHRIALELDFTLERTGMWSRVDGEEGSMEAGDYKSWGSSYEPASPFQD